MMLRRTALGTRITALLVAIVVVVGTVALISLSHQPNTSPPSSSSSLSAGTTSSYPSGQPYMNASKLYASLGYPKITYSGSSPYLPSSPGYYVGYQTKGLSFHVGDVEAPPMIGVTQAVALAAEQMKLDPSNYTLVQADFQQGAIVNSSLTDHPYWSLTFARVYDGYWLYGNYGAGFSVSLSVDASNGTVRGSPPDLSSLPTSGLYELKVNSSQALQHRPVKQSPGRAFGSHNEWERFSPSTFDSVARTIFE